MKAYKFITLFLIIAASYSFAQFTNDTITTNTYDQSEPTITVSPLNSNYVLAAWNDFRDINNNVDSKPGYALSTNAGQTWSKAIVTTPGYTNGFDPSVAFDKYGNAFYCYIAQNQNDFLGRVYVSRTTDFGSNWNYTEVSTATQGQDKPFIAMDNTGDSKDGRIYVSWTNFIDYDHTQILFSYSTDHGVTFSTPCTLATQRGNPGPAEYSIPTDNFIPENTATSFVHGSTPIVAPNGDLYVIYADVINILSTYNDDELKIRKSTDGGISFYPPVTAALFSFNSKNFGYLNVRTYFSSIAVDPVTGYIYLTYPERLSETDDDLRVKFVRSTDGGNEWSDPEIIADIGTGEQLIPWVSVNESGRIAVLFIHSSSSTALDAYITESYDNGVSFLPAFRVSTQSSDPNNATWSHHYHGIFNTNGANSYCVWTDYGNGNADIYFSKVNPPPLSPVGFHITDGIGEHPTLHWAPNIEFDLDGYKIYTSHNQGAWNLLTTVDKNTTSFTDPGVTITDGKFDPTVCYNISAFDIAGNESEQFWRPFCVTSSTVEKKTEEQTEVNNNSLSEAFPNPFNPTTKINYSVHEKSIVTLKVFDVLGNLVANLVDEEKPAGIYEVNFDANGLTGGVYFYLLQANNFIETKKMILLR